MPYLAVGALNVKRNKHRLAAGFQGQTCSMYKVPKHPLGAVGAVEPKLVVKKLKLCLERECEAVYHHPL